MPDLALLITMVLAGDHPLAGPPPRQVLDPVPRADLLRASVAGIPGLLDDLDADTRNVVLTFARIWTTLAAGEIRSKVAAADWALAQLTPESIASRTWRGRFARLAAVPVRLASLWLLPRCSGKATTQPARARRAASPRCVQASRCCRG